MMKRILAVVLILSFVLTFSACRRNVGADSVDPSLSEEELQWNKMWDLWAEGNAESPYEELMTYQAEVNNGGHDQYFYNVENTGDLQKELSVLNTVLPEKLRTNLQTAYAAHLEFEETEDEAAEETMNECDHIFYENEAELNAILEEYASTLKV